MADSTNSIEVLKLPFKYPAFISIEQKYVLVYVNDALESMPSLFMDELLNLVDISEQRLCKLTRASYKLRAYVDQRKHV